MAYINDMNPDRFSLEYILKENFYDEDSFLVSSNFLYNLNESEKMSLADMMGSSAFKHTEKKLQHLNKKGYFLDLPKTGGDIRKSTGYKTTKQCLNILKPIMEKAKGKNTIEAVQAFQTCEATLTNLEKNILYFEKAYKQNDSANILAFQTISLALFEFTSIVLINCTSFTETNSLIYRDPPNNSLNKNILAKNLNKFNDICRNNKLKLNEEFENKIEETMMVYGEGIGDVIGAIGGITGASGAAAVGLGVLAIASSIIALIYIVRILICYFYFKKTEVSENLRYASDMIEANSLAVSNGNPRQNKAVSKKQSNLAASLKKIGNKLDSDSKQAEHNAISTMKQEDSNTTTNIERQINPDVQNDVTPRNNLDNLGDDLFI